MKNKKLQIRNSTAEFLIFTKQENKNTIEVRIEDETVWLTQKLIGILFEKSRNTITEHLQKIFETGELVENSVCRDFRHTEQRITKTFSIPSKYANFALSGKPIKMNSRGSLGSSNIGLLQ